MPAATRRSFFVTIFGVIGTLWFAVHAIEYVFARYSALEAAFSLPAPLGLSGVFEAMPQWAGIALTAAIWLGLLGAFLLLLGDRASVLILSFALLATGVALVWAGMAYLGGNPAGMAVDPLMFIGSQTAMTFALWLYSRTAKRAQVI
jgi:multisubunit Na+/H+ antiporter MnhC subunit